MTSLTCIYCGQVLETHDGVVCCGVLCEARRSPGSRVFDAHIFGGEPHATFVLCDDCLVEMRRLGRVEVVVRAPSAPG